MSLDLFGGGIVCMASLFTGSYKRNQRPAQAACCFLGNRTDRVLILDIGYGGEGVVFLWIVDTQKQGSRR